MNLLHYARCVALSAHLEMKTLQGPPQEAAEQFEALACIRLAYFLNSAGTVVKDNKKIHSGSVAGHAPRVQFRGGQVTDCPSIMKTNLRPVRLIVFGKAPDYVFGERIL
ncbi:hypothetical protein SDC9_148672 [bioreactor metagenome]|uniref:Uncharacterized protein n=1 Tax=bioreactor metagenome TaxID=1076179 RepID=A0A645ELP8_9ZZZZ